MPAQTVDITQKLVAYKLDVILDDYLPQSQKTPFENPYIKKRLIAQILKLTHPHYARLNASEADDFEQIANRHTLSERILIERLIHTFLSPFLTEAMQENSPVLSLRRS